MRSRRVKVSLEDDSGDNFFDDGLDAGGDDPAASTDAADPLDDSGGEPEVDLNPDNEVLPLDDLNVNELEKNEIKAHDDRLQEMAEAEKETRRSINDIVTVSAALEAYRAAYASADLEKTKVAYTALGEQMTRVSVEHQLVVTPVVSVESIHYQSYSISMESVGTLIKTLIDKVLMFFNRLFAWLKKVYHDVQANAFIISAANAKAKDNFVRWRRQHGDKLKQLVEAKGLYNKFCELPIYKKALTADGVQPGVERRPLYAENTDIRRNDKPRTLGIRRTSYAEEMCRMVHNGNYLDRFIKGFPGIALVEYRDAAEKLTKNIVPLPITHVFDASWKNLKADETFVNFYPLSDSGDPDQGADVGVSHSAPKTGYAYYSTYFELGNWRHLLSVRTDATYQHADYQSQMFNLANWTVVIEQDPNAGLPVDDWMWWLETGEAMAAFASIDAMLKEMKSYQKRMDQVEMIADAFRKNLDRIALGAAQRPTTDEVAPGQVDNYQKVSECIVLTTQAYNNIIKNLSALTGPWLSIANTTTTAWYYYIKATLDKERELLGV